MCRIIHRTKSMDYLSFENPENHIIKGIAGILKNTDFKDAVVVISPAHIDPCQVSIWKVGPNGILISDQYHRPKHTANVRLGNIPLFKLYFLETKQGIGAIEWKCRELTEGKVCEKHPSGSHIFL